MTTSMQKIKLAGNNLHGNIPSEIGGWTGLVHADLSDNSFDGVVPEELFSLTDEGSSLEYLNITGNPNLSGNIPDSACSFEDFHYQCSSSLCGCRCWCPVESRNPP